MSPQARSHLGVFLSFTAVSLIVTWPLVIRFTEGVPYGGDAFQFIWNGWWMSKVLSNPELTIWFTPYQYALSGASLILHDLSPLNAWCAAMLGGFIGDFGAHNFLILFHYMLGAWGAYILAFYLTGNRPASVIAGVIYGFSTFHAMHLPQLSTVSSGWLPLGVYYLLKYVRDGGWRDGVLAVLMIVAGALSHWYHLVFIGASFFGLMIIGQFGLKEHLSGRRRWMRCLTVWFIALLMLSPMILAALGKTAIVEAVWKIETGKRYYLDPVWLVIPPPDHPVFGQIVEPLRRLIPGNVTEGVASLGLVAIFLGFAAWFRRNPATRAWCWLGLFLFLLAYGPTLTILGVKTGVPGLFRIWSEIPGINMVRIPARFAGPLTLAIAVASAGFIAGLGHDWRKGVKRTVLLWVIPAIIVFETLVIPVPITGSEYMHPVLDNLGEIYREATGIDEDPDLIVNFPVLPVRTEFSLQQTRHGIPTVDGAISNPPEGAMDFFFNFNWNPVALREMGVDMMVYQPWAAKTSLQEKFHIPESHKNDEGEKSRWAGESVEPVVFFREVMEYRVAYEDDNLIVFIP